MKRIVKKKTRVEVRNSATLNHETRGFGGPRAMVVKLTPIAWRNPRAKSRMNTGDVASHKNCDGQDANPVPVCVKRGALTSASKQ